MNLTQAVPLLPMRFRFIVMYFITICNICKIYIYFRVFSFVSAFEFLKNCSPGGKSSTIKPARLWPHSFAVITSQYPPFAFFVLPLVPLLMLMSPPMLGCFWTCYLGQGRFGSVERVGSSGKET